MFLCLEETAFTREHYGQPFKIRLQFMRRLCEKAKVERFGFHAVRHLSASILSGGSITFIFWTCNGMVENGPLFSRAGADWVTIVILSVSPAIRM